MTREQAVQKARTFSNTRHKPFAVYQVRGHWNYSAELSLEEIQSRYTADVTDMEIFYPRYNASKASTHFHFGRKSVKNLRFWLELTHVELGYLINSAKYFHEHPPPALHRTEGEIYLMQHLLDRLQHEYVRQRPSTADTGSPMRSIKPAYKPNMRIR